MAGVFISYSVKDRMLVTRMYDALRAENIPVWVDFEGISPAMPWQEEIESAIVTAGTFIYVLSPDSVQSELCQHELEFAILHQKHIIPVIARPVTSDEMPFQIVLIQSIDFTRQDRFDEAVRHLLRAMESAEALLEPMAQAPREASLARYVVWVRVLILAFLVLVVATSIVVSSGLHLANPQLLMRRYLTLLVVTYPFAWLTLAAGSLLLNLVLCGGVVVMWRRGHMLQVKEVASSEPSGEIFISYSRSDSEFVDKLEEDLGKERFKTWIDRRRLKGGQIWDATIVEALNRCQLVIVVMSPDALKSGWVRKEYRYAMRRGKAVVPIQFHPCPSVPRALSRLQKLDFQAGLNFEAKYRYAFVELVSALEMVPVARVETVA